MLLGTGPV